MYHFTIHYTRDGGTEHTESASAALHPSQWGVGDLGEMLRKICALIGVGNALCEIDFVQGELVVQIGSGDRSARLGPLPVPERVACEYARTAAPGLLANK